MNKNYMGSNENTESRENKHESDDKIYDVGKENKDSPKMYTSKTFGVVGLYNLGNTCYMNSLLQCLKNLFPLTNFILTNKFEGGKLINQYRKLLCNLISTKNGITDAVEYHKALGIIDPYFDTKEQRDSSKLFLTHIKSLMEDSKTEILESEISNGLSRNIEENETDLAKRYKKSKMRNPSQIYDLFFGFLKNITYCEICKQKDIKYQPYSIINLDLTNDKGENILTLDDLILNYEMEKYSNFGCVCGSKKLIEKSFLGRIPPILVFKFQRSINGKHVDHKIKYSDILYMNKYADGFLKEEDNIKNPQLKFHLSGVMLHYGGALSGHKTSYTKNFINGDWYYFDDTSKYIENNVLDDRNAFMLFYISDSRKITENRIEKLIRIAEKESEKCNYISERYRYSYKYYSDNSNSYYNYKYSGNDSNYHYSGNNSNNFNFTNCSNNYNFGVSSNNNYFGNNSNHYKITNSQNNNNFEDGLNYIYSGNSQNYNNSENKLKSNKDEISSKFNNLGNNSNYDNSIGSPNYNISSSNQNSIDITNINNNSFNNTNSEKIDKSIKIDKYRNENNKNNNINKKVFPNSSNNKVNKIQGNTQKSHQFNTKKESTVLNNNFRGDLKKKQPFKNKKNK